MAPAWPSHPPAPTAPTAPRPQPRSLRGWFAAVAIVAGLALVFGATFFLGRLTSPGAARAYALPRPAEAWHVAPQAPESGSDAPHADQLTEEVALGAAR